MELITNDETKFLEYYSFWNKHIDIFIGRFIPAHISENYPKFIQFIRLWLLFSEQKGEAVEFIQNMMAYGNIDETTLDFLENFVQQYLQDLKIPTAINKRTLVKYISQWYKAKGTEPSYRFLFSLLYGENVEIYYPKDDILRVSDGKWQYDTVIKISVSEKNLDKVRRMAGTEIVGSDSKARALVDKVFIYKSTTNISVASLFISEVSSNNPIRNFKSEELINCKTFDDGELFQERIFPLVIDLDIPEDNASRYFAEGDFIHIIHPYGSDAMAVVSSVHTGSIDDLIIVNGGEGYEVGDRIIFISDTGYGAVAEITAVDSNGAITEFSLDSRGTGYASLPAVSIQSTGGHDAVLQVVSNSIGKIKTVKITNNGVNYKEINEDDFETEMFDSYTFDITFVYSNKSISWADTTIQYYKDDVTLPDPRYNEDVIVYNSDRNRMMKARISRLDIDAGLLVLEFEERMPVDTSDAAFVYCTESNTELKVLSAHTCTFDIINGAIAVSDGYWRNMDGWLDSDKVIQDSYYYQLFSYVLISEVETKKWMPDVLQYLHPAGLAIFGLDDSNVIRYELKGTETSMGPLLNDIELYKFYWRFTPNEVDNEISLNQLYANHGIIRTFANYPIYECAWVVPEEHKNNGNITKYVSSLNKYINITRNTTHCYGSEIQYINDN